MKVESEEKDPPVITDVKPSSGTEFARGDVVRFRALAEDEDGDELEYVWREEGTVIGSGPFVDLVLPKGRHDVILVVSDGSSETVQHVLIEVVGDEPGATVLGWVVVLLILLVVVVVLVILWKRHRNL